MYAPWMKRLQIMLDEELDEALGQRAARDGVSKASIIRECVRAWLKPLPPLDSDPITRMVGADDVEPADIDDIVYR
jgi:plasmid stability protein